MSKNKILIWIIVSLIIVSIVYAADHDLDGIPDDKDKYPYDFDNDGMPDLWEKKNGLRFDVYDADKDEDNDGMTNLEEYQKDSNPLVYDIGDTLQKFYSPFGTRIVKISLWIFILLFLGGLAFFVFYKKHVRGSFAYKIPERKTPAVEQRLKQYEAYQIEQAYRQHQEKLRQQRMQQYLTQQKAMQQRMPIQQQKNKYTNTIRRGF